MIKSFLTKAAATFQAQMAFVCVVLSSSAVFAAPHYQLTDLGSAGALQSWGADINAVGQVTGTSRPSAGKTAGFQWNPATPNSSTGSSFDLGGLTPGVQATIAIGLNGSGQVVGTTVVSGVYLPFLWTPNVPNGSTGTMVSLGKLPKGTGFTRAAAINSSGQVVGYSDENSSAFLWTPSTPNGSTGTLTDLGNLPGTQDSWAQGINSSGQVVGFSKVGNYPRPFLWTPNSANGNTGSMIGLGVLPGGVTDSVATAINDSGLVVGYSDSTTGERAFLWKPDGGGTMINLDPTPGDFYSSSAYGVNSDGTQVVGGRQRAATGLEAFLWTPTDGMMNLTSLLDESGDGWRLIQAGAVNDVGQIVGWGFYDPDGIGGVAATERAFLITPIPEPAGLSVAFLFTCAVSGLRRRRDF